MPQSRSSSSRGVPVAYSAVRGLELRDGTRVEPGSVVAGSKLADDIDWLMECDAIRLQEPSSDTLETVLDDQQADVESPGSVPAQPAPQDNDTGDDD